MIDTHSLFNEIKDTICIRCDDCQDSAELIHVADAVVSRKIPVISVPPEFVEPVWTWLENTPVQIIASFVLDVPKKKGFDKSKEMSDLSTQIMTIFKKGATGAEVFLPVTELPFFTEELITVRDDLFFNKSLSIGLDINHISSGDWQNIFIQLTKIRADALTLYSNGTKKDNDYFVGRIYALMEIMGDNFNGDLHFILGADYQKIEQVWRLVEKMRPDLLNRLKFFLNI